MGYIAGTGSARAPGDIDTLPFVRILSYFVMYHTNESAWFDGFDACGRTGSVRLAGRLRRKGYNS